MILRPASASDADVLGALEEACFGADAWSVESLRSAVTGPDRRAVVAVADAEVAGYALAWVAGEVIEVGRMAVHPDQRRAGLGRELLAGVCAEGHRVLLEVSEANQAARAFYAAEGFTQIHRRPRYYRDGTDALVLERPLA